MNLFFINNLKTFKYFKNLKIFKDFKEKVKIETTRSYNLRV